MLAGLSSGASQTQLARGGFLANLQEAGKALGLLRQDTGVNATSPHGSPQVMLQNAAVCLDGFLGSPQRVSAAISSAVVPAPASSVSGLQTSGLASQSITMQQLDAAFLEQHATLEQANAELEQRNAALEIANANLEHKYAALEKRDAALATAYTKLQHGETDLEHKFLMLQARNAELSANASKMERAMASESKRAALLEQSNNALESKATSLSKVLQSVQGVVNVLKVGVFSNPNIDVGATSSLDTLATAPRNVGFAGGRQFTEPARLVSKPVSTVSSEEDVVAATSANSRPEQQAHLFQEIPQHVQLDEDAREHKHLSRQPSHKVMQQQPQRQSQQQPQQPLQPQPQQVSLPELQEVQEPVQQHPRQQQGRTILEEPHQQLRHPAEPQPQQELQKQMQPQPQPETEHLQQEEAHQLLHELPHPQSQHQQLQQLQDATKRQLQQLQLQQERLHLVQLQQQQLQHQQLQQQFQQLGSVSSQVDLDPLMDQPQQLEGFTPTEQLQQSELSPSPLHDALFQPPPFGAQRIDAMLGLSGPAIPEA